MLVQLVLSNPFISIATNHLGIYIILLTRKRSSFEFCYQVFLKINMPFKVCIQFAGFVVKNSLRKTDFLLSEICMLLFRNAAIGN